MMALLSYVSSSDITSSYAVCVCVRGGVCVCMCVCQSSNQKGWQAVNHSSEGTYHTVNTSKLTQIDDQLLGQSVRQSVGRSVNRSVNDTD